MPQELEEEKDNKIWYTIQSNISIIRIRDYLGFGQVSRGHSIKCNTRQRGILIQSISP